MPQMFPMPIIVLMLWIGVMLLLGTIRIYWFMTFSKSDTFVSEKESGILNFKQTW